MDVEDFIRIWANASASERQTAQSFVIQLCRVLGVAAPNDEKVDDPDYGFERIVRFRHDDLSSHWGYIDCYRRECFVLEAKQTAKRLANTPDKQQMKLVGPDVVERKMEKARAQAKGYARALDEWPPFLIMVDVGRTIELWSDFSRMGKTYLQYPERENYRIALSDLRDPKIRERLAAVWSDPMSLDPARRVEEATTEIAALLGRLVQSFRKRFSREAGAANDPVHRAAWERRVAVFVMQCVFAMFADSIKLIPDRAFGEFLKSYQGAAKNFSKAISQVFRTMDTGGYCPVLRCDMLWYNGGLYAEDAAIAVSESELDILCKAAACDWAKVEPAIFGALMENALSAGERGELGAHYTPKAMVETLVQATIIDVLQNEWEATSVQIDKLEREGYLRKACELAKSFHDALCHIAVLDPACGTGNFLYIAMDRMKGLEGEVVERLASLGVSQRVLETDGLSVGPRQFMGIEKNPQAVWIATVVMWIGHLQWHYRHSGQVLTSNPVLKNYCVIEQGDAILRTTKIPCSSSKDGVRHIQPCAPTWPKAHFIIGNPPFIAGKNLRGELGTDYAGALWASRGERFRSADIVTVWWDRAAEILIEDAANRGPFDDLSGALRTHSMPAPALQRFGFVTTNSITQTFSRRVIEERLQGDVPIRLTFAIADHPWTKGKGAAAVRVAMLVAEAGPPNGRGRLLTVARESAEGVTYSEARGDIGSDLTIGRRVERTVRLKANATLAHRGVQLMGDGFLIASKKAAALANQSVDRQTAPLRSYRNGKDLTDRSRNLQVIDLFGWPQDEAIRQHPGFMQHLMETVKPDRDTNNRASYRDNWWIFGEPRRELRRALKGLPRFIATVETSKHRWFRFLDASILPDNRLVCIASDDAFVLGVLSSRVHRAWALAVGGKLEDRPVYSKGTCFDRFPFPDASPLLREEIATFAEGLDHLRSRALAQNPDLSMTGLYNVMEKVLAGVALTEHDRAIRQAGCVDLLLHASQRLDALVLQAYGWPSDLGDEAVISHLVELNRSRAAEEDAGQIRYLRPVYQTVNFPKSRKSHLTVQKEATASRPILPSDEIARIITVLEMMRGEGRPLGVQHLQSCLEIPKGAKAVAESLRHTLEILTAAGSIYRTDAGWFAPRRMPS